MIPSFFSYILMVILIYPVYQIIPLSWYQEWIQKSDSILSFYPSIQGKYPLIDESLPYYMGLLEMAICFVKDFSSYSDYAYMQMEKSYIVKDVKERELAETLKSMFWDSSQKQNMKEVIRNHKNYCFDLVIARLLYPDYYFQTLDDIVNHKVDSSYLEDIIKRVDEYEQYIMEIVGEVSSFYPLKKYPSL